MTKFRLALLCLYAAALVSGIVYLTLGTQSLPIFLPLFSLFFLLIAAVQFAEVRAADARGILAYLPAAATALVALIAVTATLLFFASR